MFYPPLSHYLAALLSLIMDIGMAMKLLITLSLLILPMSFYHFSRRWTLDHFQASVCATCMTSFLFLSGEMLGAWPFGIDLQSALNVGLFANVLSQPALFLFLAHFGARTGSKSWKIPALLLGFLFLCHPLSSLIAGIFVVGCLISNLWREPNEPVHWKPQLLTLIIATLLGSYWLIPFVGFRNLMNAEFVGSQWSPAIQFVVLNGLLLAIASFSKPSLRPLTLTFLILANFILIGTLWRFDLQFPRLTIYLFFFLPVFVVIWIQSRVILLTLATLGLAVGLYGYQHSGLKPAGVPDFPLPDFGPVSGRILSVAPPSHLPSYHVHHDLIPIRTGNHSLLGLFIESSFNGRFLGNLMRTLDPEAHLWGVPSKALTREALGEQYTSYVNDRLRLFGIGYIYTDLKLENTLDAALVQTKRYINSYPAPKLTNSWEIEDLRKRYNARGEFVDFYLYRVGSWSLAEALPYIPGVPGTEWKTTNLIWFLESRGVPIFTDRPIPAGVWDAKPNESVEVTEVSPTMDRIKLQIRAEKDIPVLLKVSYFPTWTLTLNGKRAPIYRASPSLLLLFGRGEALLELKRPWEEYLGLFLSALGILLIIFL